MSTSTSTTILKLLISSGAACTASFMRDSGVDFDFFDSAQTDVIAQADKFGTIGGLRGIDKAGRWFKGFPGNGFR